MDYRRLVNIDEYEAYDFKYGFSLFRKWVIILNLSSQINRISFETLLEFTSNMPRSQQSKDAVPQQYEWK